MGAGALALLLGALGFQYFVHLAPCEMCHWQRWPHIAAAIIGIVLVPLLRNNTRALAWLVVALIALSGLIGAYQAGLQWGFLPGPQGCTVAHAYVHGFRRARAASQLQCRDLEPVRPVAGGIQCASSRS